MREALRCGHNYVGTEHLLLSLLHIKDGFPRAFLMWLAGPSDSTPETSIVEKIRTEVLQLAPRAKRYKSFGTIRQNTGPVRVKDLLHVGPLHVDVRFGKEATTLVATWGKRFASLQMGLKLKLKTGTLRSERHRSLLRLVS